MANLPPTLDFAKTEEDICAKWAAEDTFKNQDALSLARGDKVSEGRKSLTNNMLKDRDTNKIWDLVHR